MRNRGWKKKAAVSVIFFAMALGCASCGKSSEEYIAERLAEMNGGNVFYQDSETEQQAKDIMQGILEDIPAIKEEGKKQKKEASFGTWNGNVYTNEYLGLTCTFDSNWTIYSAAELQEINGEVSDVLEQSNIGQYLENMQFFKDMMAENAKDLTSVNITYSKMSKQDRERYAKLTEKEIVEKTLNSVDLVADTYEQMGMTLKSASSKNIDFLGERRTVQYMHFDYMGTAYYALQIYDYHSGEYATVLTLASYVEDKTTQLLDMFTKCE